MMGRREIGQGQFFYSFDLDKVVPPDHLVRQINAVLDLSWIIWALSRQNRQYRIGGG
jgi:hypothetical protein